MPKKDLPEIERAFRARQCGILRRRRHRLGLARRRRCAAHQARSIIALVAAHGEASAHA